VISAEYAIARGTASPVIVTDEQQRIVTTNDAARRLLGGSEEFVGRSCFALLRGKDASGNCFCHEHCVVEVMATTDVAVSPFELTVAVAGGKQARVACSVVVIRSERPGRYRVVHILTPLPPAATESVPPVRMTGLDERPYALTQREAEVLCLLAHGKSCHQIAGELFISLPTVRNHVHNFLRKLDVHSQVEAVARAFREGLV
jgi:DNA-binding CsgD family transcriptional regulator